MRLIACDPPLGTDEWTTLADALAKLFTQFEREGRVTRWGSELAADGSIVALAWQGAETLSGCSHDKLSRLLLAFEERHSLRLVNAPPLVVESGGRTRCMDRAALRALVATAKPGADGVADIWVHDLTPTDLGTWRRRPRVPLCESRFAGLVTIDRIPLL